MTDDELFTNKYRLLETLIDTCAKKCFYGDTNISDSVKKDVQIAILGHSLSDADENTIKTLVYHRYDKLLKEQKNDNT